jgi:D-alanyl-D-alanine carboxypeptidase/D-alanyl-D-alanine-endopeptidase (penicillin-binding protein 4)
MLLREVGRVRRGLGTFETSRSELRTLLEELGVGPGDYVLRDGSGLSRQNLVSPDAVVTLLGHMYRSQHRAVWLDSLPEGGVDGTLSSRFLRAKTSLIRAKTGTLTGVSALSGYAERGTEVLAFTILVNNHAAENGVIRGIMDRIVDEIIKY